MTPPDPATPPRYWFRAKTYGWGWGLPLTWEGWVSLGTFLALTIGGMPVAAMGRGGTAVYLFGTLFLAAVFVAICWWKGEPPSWRWGQDKRP